MLRMAIARGCRPPLTGRVEDTGGTNVRVYFAGPLFSEAERDWIRSAIRRIESLAAGAGIELDVTFPYDLVTVEEIDLLGEQAKHEIFNRCRLHLHEADMVIALLDGTQVDDGTAWEIGYFYRMKADGARIIGIRTDFRNAGEGGNSIVNAMIECSCDRIVRSLEELLAVLADFLGEKG